MQWAVDSLSLYIYIYIYIYVCVCVCVCNVYFGRNRSRKQVLLKSTEKFCFNIFIS